MNTSTQPAITTVNIIYENDILVAVNKPNNFLIHQSYYARNIRETTLLEFLEQQLGYPLYPIHRLDRKTSGILLLAKHKKIVSDYQGLFTRNEIDKTYYAIVRGFTEQSGIIDFPVKNDDTGVYKDAVTHYTTIDSITLNIPVHPYEHSRYSLLELAPKTGRMHQLRKHMNKISHPIVGDYKYGDRFHNRMFESKLNCHYLFLHAYSITFTDPVSQQHLHLKATFNSDWLKVFELFNWKTPF